MAMQKVYTELNYKNLLEKVSFYFETDKDLFINYVSEKFLRDYGIHEVEAIGKNFFDILSEFNSVNEIDQWLVELSVGNISSGDFKIKIRGKVNWMRFTVAPKSNGYVFVGILIDSEKELQELKKQCFSEIEKDLEVAGRYFSCLLQTTEDFKKVTSGRGILIYSPMRQIGGDWYYFRLINRKLFLLVGDFVGHGIQAGILSSVFLGIMNASTRWESFTNPIEVLSHFLWKLSHSFKKYSSEIHLSVVSAIFDYEHLQANVISFNLPVYRFDNQTLELKNINSENEIILANWEALLNKSSQVFQLHQGDWLWLFSDGAKDQFGDSNNKPFGIKRMKEILTEASSMEDVSFTEQFLLQKKAEWMGHSLQTDDITLMGIKM